MKMTRLEWTYLKRIALDHPYYDTHKLPLTEAEAMAIVDENNTMTGREFVDSVYAKLGKTRPVKEKRRFDKLRSFAELFTVPPIRRIAIVVLAVILTTVFFAATPTGRAIAESVIQYITRVFRDGSLVRYRNNSEAIPVLHDAPDALSLSDDKGDYKEDVYYVKTFEEFFQRTGKTPFVLPLQYTELYYYEQNGDIDLFSQYHTSGGTIFTCQIWSDKAVRSQTSVGYTVCSEDNTIYYSVDESHGCIVYIRVFEDSVLTVYAEGSFLTEEIIRLLRDKPV